MKYLSTRGEAPPVSFTDALLTGLAPDGGLYLPETYPALSHDEIAGFAGKPYAHVAARIMAPFVGGEVADFEAMVEAAYGGFRHAAVTPLVQLDANLFLLELFHGPTLAFKDVAMQLLGRLMDRALKERGQRATIIGATSGDTGAAAIEAFSGLEQVDVFILYPHERVSAVQRRQMTTVDAQNVHVLAIEGTFDDAQTIVKGLFRHAAFRDRVGLSGVNSINWARVMAQIVYYFTVAVSLGAPHRPVSFAVPTGNFGDIFAGYVAKRMGLPVERLVIATNANDILARTLADGTYRIADVQPTQSPSMDIQISSNFERLVFDAAGRDAAIVRRLMADLEQSRSFTLEAGLLAAIRADFDAASVDETATRAEIVKTFETAAYICDPHSAVALAAGRKASQAAPRTPMVVLGTAHPAKFPTAIEQALGRSIDLPPFLGDILKKPERFSVVANDQLAIERTIETQSRAAAPQRAAS